MTVIYAVTLLVVSRHTSNSGESNMRAFGSRVMAASVCAVAVFAASVSATAQTVPGEKWRQKISVSMEGISMPMGTSEICAPAGKPEDLMKPDKDCTTSNVKVTGNTMSANITCTGKDAMTGTVQMTTSGATVSSKAHMKMKSGEEMDMIMESTKLGPCQAIDTGAVAAKAKAQGEAIAAAQPKVDVCGSMTAQFKGKPGNAGAMAQMFVDPGQPCATKPANAAFCTAIQTRGGFAGLQQADERSKGIAAKSVSACGLGQGPAGVDALRTKLVRSAETDGDGDFLIAQAPDRARALAKSECVIKGEMWAGKAAKWDQFCDSNFASEARGR
jgi:hypothetical protein